MDKLGDRLTNRDPESAKALGSLEANQKPEQAFDITSIIGSQKNLMDIKVKA